MLSVFKKFIDSSIIIIKKIIINIFDWVIKPKIENVITRRITTNLLVCLFKMGKIDINPVILNNIYSDK